MAGESSRQSPGERRTSDGDSVQGGGPSMVGDDARLLTAKCLEGVDARLSGG